MAHAEQVLLHALSSSMGRGDYTRMTHDVCTVAEGFFRGEAYCLSGYHHSVVLLSTLSERLHPLARERLLIQLQGPNGLSRVESYVSSSHNVVSDTLFRIDSVQKDFSDAASMRKFNRLSKFFPVVSKYLPEKESLLCTMRESLKPPSGFHVIDVRLGRTKGKSSFEAYSRFMSQSNLIHTIKEDNELTRFHSQYKEEKRDYFVLLNVGILLKNIRTNEVLNFHVGVRLLSFATRNTESGKWIQPKLINLPALGKMYTASFRTMFWYFLRAFRSTQLLLAGAAAVLALADSGVGLCEIRNMDPRVNNFLQKYDDFLVLDHSQKALVYKGMNMVLDALTLSPALDSFRVDFITPESLDV